MDEQTHTTARIGRPQYEPSSLLSGDQLSDLVHKVAHEIDNPLTAIISIASVLGKCKGVFDKSDDPDRKLLEYTDSVSKEAWRISAVVERLTLLVSNRITSARATNIRETFERALRKVQSDPRYHTLEIRADFTPGVESVWIDAEQFDALMRELLENAHFCALRASASSASSSENIPQIGFSVEQTQTADVKILIDTFNASPCELELDSVFEPFTTEFQAYKRLGLGLAVAWAIVERFRGSIELHEYPFEDGYVFSTRITLPAAAKDTRSEESSRSISQKLPDSISVLIIDDEELVSSAISKILEISIGAHTKLRCDYGEPRKALHWLTEGQVYDAILCDINLAEMSGRDVFTHIRKHHPALEDSIAFITGDRGAGSTREFLELTQRPYLLKPFEPEELIDLILALVTK